MVQSYSRPFPGSCRPTKTHRTHQNTLRSHTPTGCINRIPLLTKVAAGQRSAWLSDSAGEEKEDLAPKRTMYGIFTYIGLVSEVMHLRNTWRVWVGFNYIKL